MTKMSSTKNKSILEGTPSADVLTVKHNQVTVKAGKGNDKISVSKGARNIVHGDAGKDQINIGKSAGKSNKVYGGAGNDTIKVSSKYGVTIDGGSGDDKLYGGKGNDTFIGGKGKDTFFYANGGGKDTIKDYQAGKDTLQITGGAVSKTAVAKNNKDLIITVGNGKVTLKNAAGKTISMKDTRGSYTTSKTEITLGKDFAGTMDATKYLSTVRIINGSEASKVVNITGNAWSNTIFVGKAGGTCKGGDGNDTIHITGGKGSVVYGNAGTDTFSHTSGTAVIKDYATGEMLSFKNPLTAVTVSGDGVTFTAGTSGSVTVENGVNTLKQVTEVDKKNNFYVVPGGSTDFYGSDTDDIIAVNSRKNINTMAYGGAGDDKMFCGAGNDYLYGGAGNDYLYGGAGHVELYGEDGNDYLYGGAGSNFLHGGAGSDYLYGGAGSDLIESGDDDDLLYGNDGDDLMYGGPGNDYVYGGNGNDQIMGNDGNDYLCGGNGADQFFIYESGDNILYGNADTKVDDNVEDIFYFDSRATGTNTIKDFKAGAGDGKDKIDFSNDLSLYVFITTHTIVDGNLTLNLSNSGKIVLESYTAGTGIKFYGSQDGNKSFTNFTRIFS